MRSIERIPKFMGALEKLWLKYPDLRFGQLIDMIVLEMRVNNGPFYTEEEKWLKTIEKLLG